MGDFCLWGFLGEKCRKEVVLIFDLLVSDLVYLLFAVFVDYWVVYDFNISQAQASMLNGSSTRACLFGVLIVWCSWALAGLCWSRNDGLLCVGLTYWQVCSRILCSWPPSELLCCACPMSWCDGADLSSSTDSRQPIKQTRYCTDCKTSVHWHTRLRCTGLPLRPAGKVDPSSSLV